MEEERVSTGRLFEARLPPMSVGHGQRRRPPVLDGGRRGDHSPSVGPHRRGQRGTQYPQDGRQTRPNSMGIEARIG